MNELIYNNILFRIVEEFPNYYVSKCGKIYSKKRDIIRKLHNNHCGYPSINLRKDKTDNTRQVHRIIAKTWLENSENRREVNHIDGNKENNHADNLEWVTRSENCKHACKMGLMIPPGVKNKK